MTLFLHTDFFYGVKIIVGFALNNIVSLWKHFVKTQSDWLRRKSVLPPCSFCPTHPVMSVSLFSLSAHVSEALQGVWYPSLEESLQRGLKDGARKLLASNWPFLCCGHALAVLCPLGAPAAPWLPMLAATSWSKLACCLCPDPPFGPSWIQGGLGFVSFFPTEHVISSGWATRCRTLWPRRRRSFARPRQGLWDACWRRIPCRTSW